MWIYHLSFTPLPTDRYFTYPLALVNNTAMNTGANLSLRSHILLEIDPEMGLLHQLVSQLAQDAITNMTVWVAQTTNIYFL